MKPLVLGCALLLAGCGPQAQEFAASQVRAYNEAGIDPVQLGVAERMYVSLACGTVTGLAAMRDAEVGAEIAGWCRTGAVALAPAE